MKLCSFVSYCLMVFSIANGFDGLGQQEDASVSVVATTGYTRSDFLMISIGREDEFALLLPSVERSIEYVATVDLEKNFPSAGKSGYATKKFPVFFPQNSLDARQAPDVQMIRNGLNIKVKMILGRDFFDGKVLSIENSKHRLRVGNEPSLEGNFTEYPINIQASGMYVDKLSIDGEIQRVRLSFEINSDIGLPHNTFVAGRMLAKPDQIWEGLVSNATSTRLVPFYCNKEVKIDHISVPNLVVFDSVDECSIGWGLLQRLDFEIDFRGHIPLLRMLENVNEMDCLSNASLALSTKMTADGLEILQTHQKGPLAGVLQEGDVVCGSRIDDLPGMMRQEALRCLAKSVKNHELLRILRRGEKIEIDLRDLK